MKSNNRPKTASAPAKSEQKDLPKVSSPKQMPQADAASGKHARPQKRKGQNGRRKSR